jgi:hypothetical protein
VWAALTLARRGDKGAVPRALEVFREKRRPGADGEIAEGGMAAVPHGNLQKRVLVLLSNSARAGEVPQPPPAKDGGSRLEGLSEWWKAHEKKVILKDPWLAILEKQKVD